MLVDSLVCGASASADTNMPLTDLAIKRALAGPKIIELSDGGGLQLWLTLMAQNYGGSPTASEALKRRSRLAFTRKSG